MPEISLHRPYPLNSVPHWDHETEVAVIGFGATGACAAIEARAAGSDVMLFERGSGSGGASALSGGEIYVGGGSDVQTANGFADTVDDFTTYLKMAGGPYADEAKCELYGREALNHFAWLRQQGVPFRGNFLPGKVTEPADDSTLLWSGSEAAAPFCHKALPAPRGHAVQFYGYGGGRKLVDVLEQRAQDLGVRIVTDARIVSLIADDDGRICGIIARIDNQNRFVKARKGVVLATGGFAMNPDMLERYAPQTSMLDPIGELDDGSGIQMGMGAGGDAVHMEQFFATCAWIMPEEHAYAVFINEAGQRFINEDCYHGRVSRTALDQPGSKVYQLLDVAHFSQPSEFSRITIAATGDTWEEVEAELEMPEGTLSRTMDFYNRHAREGCDPLFDKQPPILTPLDQGPFVALEMNFETSAFPFFTLGGLKTSTDGEVLDRGGKPIAGLFAAGRCTSGLPAWGHGYSSGMSLADCTFFGRQAGKKAAS